MHPSTTQAQAHEHLQLEAEYAPALARAEAPMLDHLRLLASAAQSQIDAINTLHKSVERLIEIVSDAARHPSDEVASFNTIRKYTLRMRGYRHVLLLSSAAATLSVTVPGLSGVLTYAVVAGWNRCDLPEGTELYATVASPDTALLVRYTNDALSPE